MMAHEALLEYSRRRVCLRQMDCFMSIYEPLFLAASVECVATRQPGTRAASLIIIHLAASPTSG